MLNHARRLLVLASLLAACGSPPSTPPEPTDENAPFPYTADEIRSASPVGRWRTLAVSGLASGLQRVTFVEVDAEGAVVESVAVDEIGMPVGEPSRERFSWVALRAHATFPARSTTVREASVTVPAGTFACRLYEVQEPDNGAGPRTSRYWFATDTAHAGPPIRMEVVSGTEIMMRMALVAWGDTPP